MVKNGIRIQNPIEQKIYNRIITEVTRNIPRLFSSGDISGHNYFVRADDTNTELDTSDELISY